MSKKIETLSDARKKEIKAIEKRLKELNDFRYGKEGEDCDNYHHYKMLPDIARKAIKNEALHLEMKLKMMEANKDIIAEDLRKSIMSVVKYYGVEEKMYEIEENYSLYQDGKTLQYAIDRLSNSIYKTINYEVRNGLK